MNNKMKVKDLMNILRKFEEDDIVNLSIEAWFEYGECAEAVLTIDEQNIMEAHTE